MEITYKVFCRLVGVVWYRATSAENAMRMAVAEGYRPIVAMPR